MRIILTNTLFAVASAALTAGAVLFAVPASAETADVLTRHADVRYGDLDLANTADRATLTHRIHVAAWNVCKADTDIESQVASTVCRQQAVADATRRMDTVIASATSAKRVALR